MDKFRSSAAHVRRWAGRQVEVGIRAVLSCVLLAALSVVLTSCGSSNPESSDDDLIGVDLPVVGTLGRAPRGEATIAVTVDADGRITMDKQGPLSLTALSAKLEERTRDPRWREPGRTSRKLLLINADARVPWIVPNWIMQAACQDPTYIYRIFLGAQTVAGGQRGALGWTLERASSPCGSDGIEPSVVAVRMLMQEGEASDPAVILPYIAKAARQRPNGPVWIEVKVAPPGSAAVPTGFVAQILDVALSAGVTELRLEGARMPSVDAAPHVTDARFDPGDVEGLLAYVADLKRRGGRPAIAVGDQVLTALPPGEPRPAAAGRLATLYGAGVEPDEPMAEHALDGG